jgi:tRNA-dihydrouridine synthase
MPEIVNLRNKLSPKTLLIGNGDLTSLSDINQKHQQYQCEGFMVGRGIFTNLWLFNKSVNDASEIPLKKCLDLYIEHIKLFEKTWGKLKNPEDPKKFSRSYINNFPNAQILRDQVMRTKTSKEMVKVLSLARGRLARLNQEL